MPLLARRIGRAKPSAIMAVAEKAKKLKAEGRDIISFSIGVPNFLPGDHVYQAARDALAKDSGQYGSNRGTDALLDAFLQHIEALGLTGYTRANVSTGIGAKHILYNLAEALLDEGDTIVYPSPYWTTYADIAEVLNAKILELPCPASQDYKLTPAQLDAALATKPKVFLFNNPSNPTGMVYTRDEIVALADVLVKYPDTWIIADDIYHRMVFDGIAGFARVVLAAGLHRIPVRGVRIAVGEAPRHVAVAAHDDRRQAGQAEAGDIDLAAGRVNPMRHGVIHADAGL